jgi:hypothetical protein
MAGLVPAIHAVQPQSRLQGLPYLGNAFPLHAGMTREPYTSLASTTFRNSG